MVLSEDIKKLNFNLFTTSKVHTRTMTLVKFLNGDISHYEEKEEEKLIDMIANDLKIKRVTVGLVKNEEEDDTSGLGDRIDFFVFIDPVTVIVILNMTQGNFFEYRKRSFFDKRYMRAVKAMTTDDPVSGISHWGKDDKIIFVPTHLRSYVEKNYGRLRV